MSPRLRSALAHARNILVISMVTLLIWLLAEAESLRVERARTQIGFGADANTGRYVQVDTEFPEFVTIRMEGSTARVDMLASKLRVPIMLEPGMEGVPVEPGRHLVNLREVLRNLPAVRETGASVAEVDPPFANVIVDNLVTRELPVRVEVPPGASLEGPPEPTPASIQVRMPEELAKKLGTEYQAVVSLEPQMLANLTEGRRSRIDLRPALPEQMRDQPGVTRMTNTVSVAVTLRSRSAKATLSSVPVHVRLAPTETGIWDIQMPAESRILNEVTVSGPGDIIDQLKSEKLRPIAYVPLSFEELERAAASGEPISKEPVFSELPTSLRFEVKPEQRMIRLTVKRREAAPPTPGVVPQPNGGTVGNGR